MRVYIEGQRVIRKTNKTVTVLERGRYVFRGLIFWGKANKVPWPVRKQFKCPKIGDAQSRLDQTL